MTQPIPPEYFNQLSIQHMLGYWAGLQNDEHGVDTPNRFLHMLDELTAHKLCDGTCIKWKGFPNKDEINEMIVLEDIPFTSLCNHHVIPFLGVAHIGYVPGIILPGLSKIARTVEHFARQLQVQERLTAQIAGYLVEKLSPLGVAVVLKAEHMCMTIRGVQKPGSKTTTASMTGVFADHSRTAKAEFMAHINGGNK